MGGAAARRAIAPPARALTHPDCAIATADSMRDILAAARARSGARRE